MNRRSLEKEVCTSTYARVPPSANQCRHWISRDQTTARQVLIQDWKGMRVCKLYNSAVDKSTTLPLQSLQRCHCNLYNSAIAISATLQLESLQLCNCKLCHQFQGSEGT